jgi:hypothetical protein
VERLLRNPITVTGLMAFMGCLTAIVITVMAFPVLFTIGLAIGLGSAPRPTPRAGVDGDGLPLGPVTYKDVGAHPEATLYYPGAEVVLVTGGDERTYMITSRSAAHAGAILASQDTADQIYAWYRQWLTAHGWSSCDIVRAVHQVSAQGYCRGHREHFSVAVDNRRFLEETLGQIVPDTNTIFETNYFIAPADAVSPTASGSYGTSPELPTPSS